MSLTLYQTANHDNDYFYNPNTNIIWFKSCQINTSFVLASWNWQLILVCMQTATVYRVQNNNQIYTTHFLINI